MTNKINFSAIVVEDEKLIAKNIIKNIYRANENFEVIGTASNGKEALELIESFLPNIVLTDICMPVMDGLELSKFIFEKYPFIHCVIISGHSDFSYAKTAIRYGVSDYLLKPINLGELTTTLDTIEKNLLANQNDFKVDEFSYKKPNEIVELVTEYIKNNYHETIDLAALASHFGFSISYLTKIFTKYMNMTPSKFIKEYRINISKQLLWNFSLPISTVGEKVGYPDQFHFSKTFKQITGMSPSDYREQLKLIN
ncbi:two-component system response regulator [Clostridium beijerinckii]|uniref:Stage 0 sporulation protein A homolog n=1 Tax=Clostridium beijerinckii TaxID=1520 RepID=A0A0B5QUV3_CLOBE|nr:AraC family transcriptional regulator [Clostridium beijerinckii]AJH00689.1 two-component system response regulator [Clostridium beijerinckii]